MRHLNPIERRLERFLREPPSIRNAASVIVIATALLVIGSGVVMSVATTSRAHAKEGAMTWN